MQHFALGATEDCKSQQTGMLQAKYLDSPLVSIQANKQLIELTDTMKAMNEGSVRARDRSLNEARQIKFVPLR